MKNVNNFRQTNNTFMKINLQVVLNPLNNRDGQSVLRSLIGPDRSLGNFWKSNKAVLPIFCGTTELVKGRKVVNFDLNLITQFRARWVLFYQNQYFLLFFGLLPI